MLDGAARLDILPSYGYMGERIECSLNNDREENAAEPKRPRVNGASDRGGNDFSSPRHILANFRETDLWDILLKNKRIP